MQKDDYFRIKKIPLLIGGATTSRVHTAVRIAPHYDGPVVYVPDASRSVGVAQSLLSDQSTQFLDELSADYERVRHQHANKKQTPMWTLDKARANKWLPTPVRPDLLEGLKTATGTARTELAWGDYAPTKPKFFGRRVFKNFDLGELAKYIDWGPFFQTWDLAGPFPAILDDAVVGVEARRVYADAQAMLKKIVDGRWLTANAVVALYPANSVDEDDIAFYADETRTERVLTWYGLRQQTEKPVVDGVTMPSRCLADFVAPRGNAHSAPNSGANHADSTRASGLNGLEVLDYAGLFAVTAGIGADKRAQAFEAAHDDYSSIMLKSLADRLAEAFAEALHERVRKDLWGYAAAESLGANDLIAEKYKGIRPAPGYPACPDHSVKQEMFALLQCEEIGMGVTESLAMTPAASVSGFYIGHPDSSYFNVGKIGDDQLQDLARRRHMNASELQRLLAPNL